MAEAFSRFMGADPDTTIKRFAARAAVSARRLTCTGHIRAFGQPIRTLAFFCHGFKGGIQAGFQSGHVQLLAQLLARYATIDAYVLLYACDAARDADAHTADDTQEGPGGDGGFADLLRDACEDLGRRVTVMAHATRGHCAWNPYARRFRPDTGRYGGDWYVAPGSPVWLRWARALRDPQSSLRWRFPRMEPAEIERELLGPPPVA
jgi:hypothetical protein